MFIYRISINLATNIAAVEYYVDLISPRSIVDAIKDIGYDASIVVDKSDHQKIKAARNLEIKKWKELVLFSLLFTVPVFLLHMVFMYLPVIGPRLMMPVIGNLSWNAIFQFILSTPVQFIAGKRFYVSAWKGLRHGSFGMDFLVSFGTSVAYFYSVVMCIASIFITPISMSEGHSDTPLFFETSSVLITFVILGKYLESNAKVSI